MKKYMVIVKGEDEQMAWFYDDYTTASNSRMDAAVSMGWLAELYEYAKDPDDPDSFESYILIES